MESKKEGCYSLLPLLFLGTSRATTSWRDREGWMVVMVVMVGRASINQAWPEGFREREGQREESGKGQWRGIRWCW